MNPAFRVALNETLGRPATAEEWFNYSASLSRMLGGLRVYVSQHRPPDKALYESIHALHGEGASIRGIARKLKVSRFLVSRALASPMT